MGNAPPSGRAEQRASGQRVAELAGGISPFDPDSFRLEHKVYRSAVEAYTASQLGLEKDNVSEQQMVKAKTGERHEAQRGA